jgi:hypothetical protein
MKLQLTQELRHPVNIIDELGLGELSDKEKELVQKILSFLERKCITDLNKTLKLVES